MNEEKIVVQNNTTPSQPNYSTNAQEEMMLTGGRGYWRNGLSIDETKISILIICLLAFVGLALFLFIQVGDIPITLVTLITSFVWGVAGINAASSLSGFLSNSFGSNNNNYGYNNSYGNTNSYGTSNNYGTSNYGTVSGNSNIKNK